MNTKNKNKNTTFVHSSSYRIVSYSISVPKSSCLLFAISSFSLIKTYPIVYTELVVVAVVTFLVFRRSRRPTDIFTRLPLSLSLL